MSIKEFHPNCQGCRPIVIDPRTMKPNAEMTAIAEEIYDTLSLEDRELFHAFSCLNSREPKVMVLIMNMKTRFEALAKERLG